MVEAGRATMCVSFPWTTEATIAGQTTMMGPPTAGEPILSMHTQHHSISCTNSQTKTKILSRVEQSRDRSLLGRATTIYDASIESSAMERQ